MDTPLHPSDPRLQPHLLALDREPAERGALDALARVYGEHGEWDGLLRVYEREALRAPDANARAELYFDMGCVWEERIVNRPQAMRCYQLAYRANPRARKPLVAAERVYRELGQWSMVARLLELQIDAEDEPREKAELYFALGELARQELADDRRAAEAYQNGLGLIPDHARCRDALAAVEAARAGRESVAAELRAEAEAAEDQALRASLYLRAAELLHREHRGAPEVEADLRRVLAIEPENPRACELLAETLHGSGRYDDLTTFLRDCVERETDPARRVALLARLASYAAERGDDEGALTAYESVLAIDPHQPDALAFVLPALRRRRAHGPLFELADRIAVPNAPADVVSWVLREAGDAAWREAADRARAEKYLGQLRAIAPHDPVARAFFRDLPKTLSPAEYKASYGQLVKQARGENDPAQKREHLRAAARLAAEHGSTPKEAIDAWRAVLDVDKTDAEARAHLRALYRRNERWHALVEILKQEVEQLPSERIEEKVALLEEMVDIYGRHLSMEPMVVNTLHALLQVTPGHRPTLDRLAKLYERRESWGQLADVLARKAETSDDPAERLELLHRAADLWLSRLQSPEDAIRCYEQVLAISPADARALAALRKIYEQRRAYEPLVQVYLRELENLTNDDERLRRAREVAEWGQKHLHRPARLIELWNRVLSFDSHDAKALTALAALYEREERWQALGEILQRQIAESSDKRARVMTMKKLGSVFADRLAREDLAITTWQAALDEDPENPEVFKILRDRYVRAHKFEELEALYARRGKWEEYVDVLVVQAEAAREIADKCRIYFQIAELWENKLQRTDRAARVYERVLEVDPQNVRAAGALKPLLEKGSEWRKLVQVEEVLAAADADAKSRAEKWRHVSKLYEEKLRRPTDAFASLARAIADDPTASGAIEHLEQLADATGAWAETAEAFERARPHATTPAEREDLSLRAARIYDERLENGEKAIAAYEAVLADAPEHEAAEAALARLYEATQSWAPLTKLRRAQLERTSAPDRREALRFEMARIEEDLLDDTAAAIASYEAILAERDDATSALQALARLYTKTERPAELASVLERQLARAENAAERIDLLRRLGYLAMGALQRPADAVQHFEALLEASPDDAGAEKALEKLRENQVSREAAARILANRYRARGAHEPLLSALRTLADCVEDCDERLEILLESARLEEVELKRAEDAHATYARALREAPADERAFAELDRLSALLDREAALAELITSLLSEVESVRRKSAMSMRAGDLFADLERRTDAIGAYQRALELGLPDDDARTTLRALSRLYEAEGDFAALRATLQSALDLTETAHDRKSVLLRLGALYEERLGDTAAATDAYRNALALAPDDEIALARLDTLYQGARDWERLAAVLEAKLRSAHGPGERAALHMRFGHLLAGQLNRTAEALGEFRSVLEIDADSDEAVSAIEALVEYDADLASAAAETLAPIYERRGDQEKVRTALEALLPTRAPEERVDILLRVGAMSEEAGNLERAYDAYSRALREGPGHAETRTKLGRAADALGRWPKLLEALEAEIPNVVRTDEVLAILETMADAADRKLQDPAQAIALYARMLALDAAHTLAFDRTSEILAREARFADLVALIERREPIVTEPEEAQRLATRKGELLERELRDPRAAIAAYRKASQIAPQHVETLEALERLYVAEGAHAPLLEVHLQRAELTGDAAERRRRILAAAKLAETELDDRTRAITLYRQLTDADPADVEALACLARLCEAEDDATALLGVLQLWVAAVHDDAERVSLRCRIAALTEGPLGDPAQAIELYRDILADAPDHAPTLAALEALAESGTERLRAARVLAQVYEAHGDPGALVRALEAELSETDDPSTRVSLLHRIAHL
jgi:tetratricopeptide (TPR) repeat protein